ncbi:MFS transporter [Undibacterium sp. RTI2.1]|uniref:MFS transporter n=2 Tax=Undibacterium TaxID=401469 RepID=UPI002B22FEC6|nr:MULTISPECIES: MFS transporter [unclassified Undibacterium]MEB0033144.1 MFS transporter [Undibacterium sp. RTI2.1]MEB0118943.1 MFS transporter [Undibacterium sp. RTI2.2]MEB0233178.1 MFS transporter [Undibacterium sp. 10I3]MEB0259859.1 MFS transporter [Undibacterium sp. 5I1]
MNSNGIRPPPVILMVLLLFSTQACTDIFLSGLPLIAREFGVSMDVSNLTISVYNYSQAFFVLFIGVVSELWGRRSVVLSCLLIHIAASVWIALCTAMPAMIALRAAQALGSAAVYIVLRLIIKDTMDKKAQIHATGLLVVGLVLSPILAPVLGAWIVKVSNWRNCFWAIALFEIPLFAWAWVVICESNHRQKEFRANFSMKTHLLSYYSVLENNYFLGLALIVGAAFAAFYAFISISSFMYINQYGMSETNYAYLFIGIALAYLLGNRMMSKLNASNVTPQKIVGIGIYTSMLGTSVILAQMFTHDTMLTVGLITLGTCLLRLATALINPPVQVIVTNYFRDKGAHALGLLTCIQYCFAGIGTMVVSDLSFQPSANFTISTVGFITLSLMGYLFVSRKTLVMQLN